MCQFRIGRIVAIKFENDKNVCWRFNALFFRSKCLTIINQWPENSSEPFSKSQKSNVDIKYFWRQIALNLIYLISLSKQLLMTSKTNILLKNFVKYKTLNSATTYIVVQIFSKCNKFILFCIQKTSSNRFFFCKNE